MLNVNYKGNVRSNGLVEGVSQVPSKSPFRKMGVHHTQTGIIPTSKSNHNHETNVNKNSFERNQKHDFSDKYKPLFANIPNANPDKKNSFHKESNPNFSCKNFDLLKNETNINTTVGKSKLTVLNNRRNSGDRPNGALRGPKNQNQNCENPILDNLSCNINKKHSIIGFNKHRRHSGHQREDHQVHKEKKKNNLDSLSESEMSELALSKEPLYQKYWFSRELELLENCANLNTRNARLNITNIILRKQVAQMKRAIKELQKNNLEKDCLEKMKTKITQDLVEHRKKLCLRKKKKNTQFHTISSTPQPANLMSVVKKGTNPCRKCEICSSPALPCTVYCANHITSNPDQVLFDFCTAKFSDNTQCSKPVFDVQHELPLCAEHARKRDNYDKMCAEIKPKKSNSNSSANQSQQQGIPTTATGKEKETTTSSRKRAKPSAMIRPQRRSKKRKRSSQSNANVNAALTDKIPMEQQLPDQPHSDSNSQQNNVIIDSQTIDHSSEVIIDDNQLIATVVEHEHEHALVTQASRLLEETDFTTVLNQIPADEFNELFGDPRNGVYGEPSAEETEELERALIAVDNDVKSLEKLSQTHALLDQFLSADDEVLVDVATDELPDVVFHTAYVAANTQ